MLPSAARPASPSAARQRRRLPVRQGRASTQEVESRNAWVLPWWGVLGNGCTPMSATAARRSRLVRIGGGEAQHDVKAGGQLTDLGLLQRLEIDEDQLPVDQV